MNAPVALYCKKLALRAGGDVLYSVIVEGDSWGGIARCEVGRPTHSSMKYSEEVILRKGLRGV